MKNNNKVMVQADYVHFTVNSLYSFFNHSCSPNVTGTSVTTSHDELLATRDIAKGEEVLVSYLGDTDLAQPTSRRQKMLMPWLGMKCSCIRCSSTLRPVG